jgi:hypothetical protein
MIKQVITRLREFNNWRTGKTDQTMDEAGIVPAQVTSDIYFICDQAEQYEKRIADLKLELKEYEKKLKKYRIIP